MTFFEFIVPVIALSVGLVLAFLARQSGRRLDREAKKHPAE